MGFDIFLQRVRDDGCNMFSRELAESILDRGALRPSRMIHVDYPDGKATITVTCEHEDASRCVDPRVWGCRAAEISSIGLYRPTGSTIYDRLIEIAAATGSIIYWPGAPIWMAVADRRVIAHLPLEVRAEAGEIAIVASADDLVEAINRE